MIALAMHLIHPLYCKRLNSAHYLFAIGRLRNEFSERKFWTVIRSLFAFSLYWSTHIPMCFLMKCFSFTQIVLNKASTFIINNQFWNKLPPEAYFIIRWVIRSHAGSQLHHFEVYAKFESGIHVNRESPKSLSAYMFLWTKIVDSIRDHGWE